jgi:DNA-binding transcriptional regulator YiaG
MRQEEFAHTLNVSYATINRWEMAGGTQQDGENGILRFLFYQGPGRSGDS